MVSENRRNFIKKTSLASLVALLGTNIVYGELMPKGLMPVALIDNDDLYKLYGKDKNLVVLNDKPWNAETPPHLLDDEVTPEKYYFMRNNGIIPEKVNTSEFTLTIDGESVSKKVVFSMDELIQKFKHYTYNLTLECGGNGRAEFNPPAKGNQWTTGAVACAEWTGVRLKDVLEYVGIKKDAVYVGYYGIDKHLSGDPNKVVISRGIPIQKAMMDETLLAFKMNGKDIPIAHGYPLRLVAGGWPASASGKWINRLSVRDKIHDGEKMTGSSYRVPCEPVAPGSKVEDDNMCIIESMPVKSILTFPKTGAIINQGNSLSIRGNAWAGELKVTKVYYSIDFGTTWKECALKEPKNRLAWQRFSATINFKQKGYYEVWAKAVDNQGNQQPMLVPGWNPKGYLNNACHRIAVKVV
ncbi:MAG: sulfite oxidase [Cyclobacteriaceae bacterium]|nr:sulfite oxidase [Cyclobacteriaceae bacterium]